jgi:hypothetical protein
LPDLTQPSSFTGLGTGYVETTQGSLPINIGGVIISITMIYKFGYYKSYPPPLNKNLVLEICKKRDTDGLVCNSVF